MSGNNKPTKGTEAKSIGNKGQDMPCKSGKDIMCPKGKGCPNMK